MPAAVVADQDEPGEAELGLCWLAAAGKDGEATDVVFRRA
jgi:hypothetical protein